MEGGGVSRGWGGGGLTGLNRRHSPVLLLHTGEVNKSIPGAGRGLSYLPPCCYCCLPPTQMVGLPFSPFPSHPRDASLRPDGGSLGAIVGGGGRGYCGSCSLCKVRMIPEYQGGR